MREIALQAQEVLAQADLLYSCQQVESALDRMAEEITAKLAGTQPLLLCTMLGGLIPSVKLLERFDFLVNVDYVHATRYRGDTLGGRLSWIARPATPLRDRVVLVVDDILDEGVTLAAILEDCRAAGALDVYSAVLVDKRHQRKNGLTADFVGLTVEDRYVFGYGMDYKGFLRNAHGIYAVKDGA